MRYIVEGIPVAQGRPRFSVSPLPKRKGEKQKFKVNTYDPEKSKNYKEFVAKTIQLTYKPIPILSPLKLSIYIFVPIPKSYSKKDKENALNGLLLPAKKPDVDNFVKGILDACNGLLYKDDNQIIEIYAKKGYSDNPRIEIVVEELQ